MTIQKNTVLTVHFCLHGKQTRSGLRQIHCRVYYKGASRHVSTGVSIEPDLWDGRREMATGDTEEALSINAELAAFKAGIMEQIGKCKPENLTITLIGSILKGTHVAEEDRPRMVTLVDFALDYLESRFAKKQITYQTYYNHRSYLRVFSDFEKYHTGGKPMKLMKLNPETFEAFIRYRMEWRHNKSTEAINQTLRPLHNALQYAIKVGLVSPIAAAPILENRLDSYPHSYQPGDELEGPVRFLTDAQQAQLLNYMESTKLPRRREVLQMFFFSYYAGGLRLSDILTLEWSHINWERAELRKVQYKTKRLMPIPVPLSRPAMDILHAWKGRNPRFVFDLLPVEYDVTEAKAFFMERNSKDKSFNRILADISYELGFDKPVTFHMARHTFAVNALNKGIRLEVVSALLGHTTIISTQKSYARFLKSTIEDEARKLLEL